MTARFSAPPPFWLGRFRGSRVLLLFYLGMVYTRYVVWFYVMLDVFLLRGFMLRRADSAEDLYCKIVYSKRDPCIPVYDQTAARVLLHEAFDSKHTAPGILMGEHTSERDDYFAGLVLGCWFCSPPIPSLPLFPPTARDGTCPGLLVVYSNSVVSASSDTWYEMYRARQ